MPDETFRIVDVGRFAVPKYGSQRRAFLCVTARSSGGVGADDIDLIRRQIRSL